MSCRALTGADAGAVDAVAVAVWSPVRSVAVAVAVWSPVRSVAVAVAVAGAVGGGGGRRCGRWRWRSPVRSVAVAVAVWSPVRSVAVAVAVWSPVRSVAVAVADAGGPAVLRKSWTPLTWSDPGALAQTLAEPARLGYKQRPCAPW